MLTKWPSSCKKGLPFCQHHNKYCTILILSGLFIVIHSFLARLNWVYSPCWSALVSEKSIWKNHVQRTGFLVFFELDIHCLRSLQNWFLQAKNSVCRFFQLDFSKFKYRSKRGEITKNFTQKSWIRNFSKEMKNIAQTVHCAIVYEA